MALECSRHRGVPWLYCTKNRIRGTVARVAPASICNPPEKNPSRCFWTMSGTALFPNRKGHKHLGGTLPASGNVCIYCGYACTCKQRESGRTAAPRGGCLRKKSAPPQARGAKQNPSAAFEPGQGSRPGWDTGRVGGWGEWDGKTTATAIRPQRQVGRGMEQGEVYIASLRAAKKRGPSLRGGGWRKEFQMSKHRQSGHVGPQPPDTTHPRSTVDQSPGWLTEAQGR